jgi:apolipoprotein N-acyltransferase
VTIRLLVAALSGVLGALAFPKFGIWPLAFLSVAGFSLAAHGCRPRQGALVGLVYGLALFGPMLHWTATFVGAPPWLILAFNQSWYTAALGALVPVLQRRRLWPLTVAAAWVAEEAIRDRFPFGGFPWGRWAFSQSDSPLRWFIAVGGAPLLTFAVALVGTLVAAALLAPSLRVRSMHVVAAAAVVGVGALLAFPLRPARDLPTAQIAAIQGSVPDRGLEFNARRRQVLDNHVGQTLKLAADVVSGKAPKPVLVLWPENASDIDPYDNEDAAAVIQKAADAIKVPILVGALADGPGPTHVTNLGIVWGPAGGSDLAPEGPGETYVKRHPVPFGEYIPLRSIARAINSKVNLVARDMVGGHGDGLLRTTPFPVGDVICFEVAYDGLVRSSVDAGAQLIVIQTNNATFGHSAETWQQLAMSRLRAIEFGRTVVQVATSGTSAIIGPDGRTIAESGELFTPDILNESVPLSTSRTLASRSEAFLEWLIVAIVAIALAAEVTEWTRVRRSQARMYATEAAPGVEGSRAVEDTREEVKGYE